MKRITRLRLDHGWNKSELGRHARIQNSRIGQIEHGYVIPYPVEAGRIAMALGWTGDAAALLEEVDRGPAC